MRHEKIEVLPIEKEFNDYLSSRANSRILFSGPFGSGKTTFLKHIEGINNDIFFIRLVPVNYSLSANEDVLNLIKFDILVELIEKFPSEIDIKPEEFSPSLLLQMFLIDRFSNLPGFGSLNKEIITLVEQDQQSSIEQILALQAIGSKVNKSVASVFKLFKKFKTSIEKAGDLATLETYLEAEIEKQPFGESDSITTLIRKLITRVKESKKRQSVLVVDDLDRLDPEHIFRLFNIFSAQYDINTDENKFGFDKVIFVCDLENIRKIYQHKYGSGVDFAGYIDKFYSTSPYLFDISRFVKLKVRQLIRVNEFEIVIPESIYQPDSEKKNRGFVAIAEFITRSLLQSKRLNLRKIYQYPHQKAPRYEISIGGDSYENINFPILLVFNFIFNYYSSWRLVEDALTILASKEIDWEMQDNAAGEHLPNEIYSYLISISLPFLGVPKHLWFTQHNGILEVDHRELDCVIKYQANGTSLRYVQSLRKGEDYLPNPLKVLLVVFRECNNRNILRHSEYH